MSFPDICLPNVDCVKFTVAKKAPVFGRLSISKDYLIFSADKNAFELLVIIKALAVYRQFY